MVIVAAVNDAGRGLFGRDRWGYAGSDVLSQPGVPTDVRVVRQGDGSVTLAWDAPEAAEGQAEPPGYTVRYWPTATEPGSTPFESVGQVTAVTFGPDVREGTVSGLTNGVWYELRVLSKNGEWHEESLSARPGEDSSAARLPGVPSGFRIVAERRGSVTVRWDPPTDNGGSQVTGYEIWYVPSSDRWRSPAPWMPSGEVLGSEVREHVVSGLVDYQDYSVIVAAISDKGRGRFAEKRATANRDDLDQLGLIVGHRATGTYSVDVDTWEVWVCDVPDGTMEIDLASTVRLLNREITRYFGWLSGGRYQPRFVEGGTVAVDTAVSSISPGDYGCEDVVGEASRGGSEGAVIILDKAALEGAYTGGGGVDQVSFPENMRVAVVPPYAVLPAAEFCRRSQSFGNCEYPDHIKLDWVAHEMAHAISWPHSFGGRQIVESKVYAGDNPMDLMSNNPEAPELGLNALAVGTPSVNRYAAGWVDPEDVAVHREPYASYLLSPPGRTGLQMLALPTGQPGHFISIGARVAEGYDGGIPAEGVEVYRIDQRAVACATGDVTPPVPERLLCDGTDRRTQPVPQAEPDSRRIEELVHHVYGPGEGLTVDGFRVEVTERVGDRFRVWIGNPYTGAFADDERKAHERSINVLADKGIVEGTECAERRICPDEPLPRWMMAVWITRSLSQEPRTRDTVTRFADVDPHAWWAGHVERLADLGVTTGCKTDPVSYCPHQPVTRAQMATLLVRAFNLKQGPSAGFADTDGTTHEAHIDALAAAGITAGCNTDPLRYCPHQPVTKAEMATFLVRALNRVSAADLR